MVNVDVDALLGKSSWALMLDGRHCARGTHAVRATKEALSAPAGCDRYDPEAEPRESLRQGVSAPELLQVQDGCSEIVQCGVDPG